MLKMKHKGTAKVAPDRLRDDVFWRGAGKKTIEFKRMFTAPVLLHTDRSEIYDRRKTISCKKQMQSMSDLIIYAGGFSVHF